MFVTSGLLASHLTEGLNWSPKLRLLNHLWEIPPTKMSLFLTRTVSRYNKIKTSLKPSIAAVRSAKLNSFATGGCKHIPSETIWLSSYLYLPAPPASLYKIRPQRQGGLICLCRTACRKASQGCTDTPAKVAILTPQAHRLTGQNETLTFQELSWRFKGWEIPSGQAKKKKAGI